LDNPFVSNTPTKWYVNQDWAANARAFGGASIAGYNTAVWMDRIGAIEPTDPTAMGLRDHLDAALDQGANLFLVVVYDLPNRDCFALASNGELKIKENGFNRYKNEYVTPLAAILGDAKYRGIRIVAIIEPDSLPNLVTNISDPDCQEAAGAGGYVEATQFTLNALYPITNVYSYIDIGHSGWLGWPENMDKATTLIGNAIKGTANGVNSIAGFISNTANSTPLKEPFLDEYASLPMPGNGGTQVRQAKFYEWNAHFSEFSFVNAWRAKMISNGFPSTIGMLVDTSRNGWGGTGRPTALSTSTNVDTFVNESRIDRRTHRGMWCNQASGIGERPMAAPSPGIDAYVWVKPPGESDGVATAGIIDPTDPAKGFDRFCDPTYVVPANGTLTGAIPGAPHAGRWFTDGFTALLKNAYPPL
jgi:cellulose 1,4-beta-cellobiosidase